METFYYIKLLFQGDPVGIKQSRSPGWKPKHLILQGELELRRNQTIPLAGMETGYCSCGYRKIFLRRNQTIPLAGMETLNP